MPERPSHPGPQADLQRARFAVAEAELVSDPADRFLAAYAAALQVAVVVLAYRSRPIGRVRSRGPRDTWAVVAAVAPELAEWAGFFAAAEPLRNGVAAGERRLITSRRADDLVRDAEAFLAVVQRRLNRSSTSAPLPPDSTRPGP